MASNKTQARANAQIAEAAKFALVKFPRKALVSAMLSMADAAEAEAANKADRFDTGFDCVGLAVQFAKDNPDATPEAVADGWAAEFKTVAKECAAKGCKFAEVVEPKDKDAAPTYRMTAYGRNVASITKGVIEFDVDLESAPDLTECPKGTAEKVKTGQALENYRDVQRTVLALRRIADREKNPDKALLADAKAEAREAADALLADVFDSGDFDLINGLAETLREMRAKYAEAQAAQDQTEAEAETSEAS